MRERAYILSQHFHNFGGKVRVFDMGWRIFTPDTLHNEVSFILNLLYYQLKRLKITNFFSQVNTATVKLRSGLEVQMTIKFKRTKKFDDCKMVLNILMKRIMNELHLVRFGRSDFNPNKAVTIPEYR